ncbi:hypothetical protein FQA39_LY10124 [Lamprigera yunnana]|nr:hypothetical protein FQA39_LY10124 [Lamprigera yunnana]
MKYLRAVKEVTRKDKISNEEIRNPSWWKRRTSMERCLTLLSTVILLITTALLIALVIVLYNRTNGKSNDVIHTEALQDDRRSTNSIQNQDITKNVCLTPGCIHTASHILKNMDPNVDPCDDFYQFSCGNFIKSTNIPDDKSSVTSFSVISDLLQEQLRTMIEEPIKPNEPKPFVLLKKIYKSCMNKTAIEEDGLKTIKSILKNLGGWPVLEGAKWSDGSFDWRQSVYKFRKIGYSVDYFMDFSVGIDLKNSTHRTVDLDQASLGLRREFLIKGLDDKLVKAYYDYVVDIAVIFGADKNVATKELKDSLEFEIKLANISLPNEKRRNASLLYNPMTVTELQTKYPSIPWLEYLNNVMDLTEIKIKNTDIIIVAVPTYISALEKLLSTTPKRVLANYVMSRAAAASVSYLTEELRNRQLQYSTILSGRTERESRWKECVDIASGSLSIAAGALYVRKYFNEESRQNAIQMVGDIRSEFIEILKTVDWMDDVTRKHALEKAAAMTSHIAYPDELLSDDKLEEFYAKLQFSSSHYLKTILNLTLFGTEFSFTRLNQPVNKTDWITHGRPSVVNAFYSSIENSIQFPAGILQGTFFNNDRPRYMNYGAIGFVIGHEITHGFDDQGRQFDKDGNLVDWWAPQTKEAFIKKAQCIIDQYGNYTLPEIGLNLNGINTQGENIADNGGIKEAYLAYSSWVKRNGAEPKLPGLNYTPHQLFWMSAANTWCSKYRPETLKLRVLTGYHSPATFRVRGPLSNLEHFSKDFNCPLGTKMNPTNKCHVCNLRRIINELADAEDINQSTHSAYTLKNDDVCLSENCVRAAFSILESIDTSVDPCDNFYNFACGNYIKNNIIPDDKAAVTTFTVLNDKLQQQLRLVFEDQHSNNENKIFKLVKNYYQACIDTEKTNKLAIKTLKNLLIEVGDWPVLHGKNWNEDDFNWRNLTYKFNKIGFDSGYFLQLSVGSDLKNNSVRSIQIDQPEFGISRDFLIKGESDKYVEAYFKFMVNVAVELGCSRKIAETELKEALNFEIKLAEIAMSKETRRNITQLYNVVTVRELQEKFSDLPWLEYINNVLPQAEISSNESLILVSPKYTSELLKLINQTTKRVQANFAIWRAINDQIPYLTDNLIQHQLNFHHVLIGVTQKQSRWKECVDEVAKGLPLLTSALYVRKYFNNEAKENALEMITYIKEAFDKILISLDWMDEVTRKSALEKSAFVENHVGYPDELLDNNKLEEYYKSLQIYPDQYLMSRLNIEKHTHIVYNKRLREPVNKSDWIEHGHVAQVNAFYNPVENSIMVPAGILQGIYFNKDRPRYMNYAAIGSVIGHELTHGFDDTGKQFDKNGILTDWWEQQTKELFLKKTQCIIEQYGNYTVPETNEKLNGINTQGENIADNGGIKEAYFAYKDWVKKNQPEPTLPGLNYTPNQLFWISAAMNWCGNYRPEVYTWLITTDVHSISEFRVLGPFSNLPHFAIDFQCGPNSKMNPVHKCTVW